MCSSNLLRMRKTTHLPTTPQCLPRRLDHLLQLRHSSWYGRVRRTCKKKSCVPTTCPNGQPLSQASDTRRYFLIHWDSCGALYIFLFNKRNCIFLDTCILFSSTMGDKQVCAWGQCSRVKKKKRACTDMLQYIVGTRFIPIYPWKWAQRQLAEFLPGLSKHRNQRSSIGPNK